MRVSLLTNAGARLAVADAISVKATQKLSEAAELKLTLPRLTTDGPGLEPTDAAAIATRVEVLDDAGNLQHSGIITKRSYQPQATDLTALTEEILLERNTLPRNYGPVLAGKPITDIARALLVRREVAQLTTQADWQGGTLSGLDSTTEPGVLMLAKSGTAYNASGTGTWQLDASAIDGFTAWERLRWRGDLDETVAVSVRYRAAGGAWSAWYKGGLPETVGVAITGAASTAATLELEAKLETSDTTTEDANGDPTGVTPYLFALEAIAQTSSEVSEGSIPTTDPTVPVVYGIDDDPENALKALAQACKAVGWEFRVVGTQLSVVEEYTRDRTPELVLRDGDTFALTELEESDEELVNVLTAYGPGEGIDAMVVVRRDSASIAALGLEVPRSHTFPTATDRADLTAQADAYLAAHSTPPQAFQGVGVFPKGEEPDLRVGDTVRVAVPSTGGVTTTRVMQLERSEEAGLHRLTLYLGRPSSDLLSAIHKPTEDKQRKLDRRPLSAPIFRLGADTPGLVAYVNPFAGGTSLGSEVSYGTAQGFDPDAEGIIVNLGANTRQHLNATPAVRYYARARAYDAAGRRSAWTEERTAVAGKVADGLQPGDVDYTKLASDLEPIRLVSSLPVMPDPAYTVGTSLVLLTTSSPPRLYRCVGSTGTPSADWRTVAADAELTVTAGKLYADGVEVGTISAGAIRTQELDAFAVTADKLAAGAVTADKLTLRGVPSAGRLDMAVWPFDGSPLSTRGVGPDTSGGGEYFFASGEGRFGDALAVPDNFTNDVPDAIESGLWTPDAGATVTYNEVEGYAEIAVTGKAANTSAGLTSGLISGATAGQKAQLTLKLKVLAGPVTPAAEVRLTGAAVNNATWLLDSPEKVTSDGWEYHRLDLTSYYVADPTGLSFNIIVRPRYNTAGDYRLRVKEVQVTRSSWVRPYGAPGGHSVAAYEWPLPPQFDAEQGFVRMWWNPRYASLGPNYPRLFEVGNFDSGRLKPRIAIGRSLPANTIELAYVDGAGNSAIVALHTTGWLVDHAWYLIVGAWDQTAGTATLWVIEEDGTRRYSQASLAGVGVPNFAGYPNFELRTANGGHQGLVDDFAIGRGVIDERTVLDWVAADAPLLDRYPAHDAGGGALSVLDAGGVEQVRLGRITGYPGVPAGVDYGLFGELNTGVFIRGAPRVIGTGYAFLQPNFGTVSGGSNYAATASTTVLSSATVPAGKKWVFLTTATNVGSNLAGAFTIQTLSAEGQATPSGGGAPYAYNLPAGSYTNLVIAVGLGIHALTGASGLKGQVYVGYLLIEVDA